MKRNLIRYKTKPEETEENERLIKDVFPELHAKSPEGIRYMALKFDDGTFVHFVAGHAQGNNPVTELAARDFRYARYAIEDAELTSISDALADWSHHRIELERVPMLR